MYAQNKKTIIYSSVLPFILKMIKPFRYFISARVIVGILWAVDLSLRPYIVKVILNRIGYINPSEAMEELWAPVMFYIFLSALIVIIFRVCDALSVYFMPKLRNQINSYAATHILEHSHSYFQNNFAGSLANKINDVSKCTADLLSIFIDRLFSHSLALLIAVYALWQVELKFAVSLLLWTVLILLNVIYSSKKFLTLSDNAAEQKSYANGQQVDILSNVTSVRLFSNKFFEKKFLSNVMASWAQAMRKRDYFFFRLDLFQGISFIILQSICLYWLIIGVQKQTLTAGDFSLILGINTSIVGCLWSLTHDIKNFGEALGNISQGLRTIMAPIEIQDAEHAKILEVTEGIITFKDVEFHYRDSLPLFKNLNITIKSKQKVGLVGFSGSGKSTFVNLILRLFDINSGHILIDNQDISQVTQDSLRGAIGMIPQDSSLFHRALIENIRYGKLNATDEEVMEAAKKARAHEFIEALPLKYDSLVGERGIKLSGGQRQRIAIARAILKNASILILDEATSALDSITESIIQESINELMKDKTTLVIAHRLSTLLMMDRIIVFDQGEIIEDGTHEELLNIPNGHYKKLWEAQVGGFLPEKHTLVEVA